MYNYVLLILLCLSVTFFCSVYSFLVLLLTTSFLPIGSTSWQLSTAVHGSRHCWHALCWGLEEASGGQRRVCFHSREHLQWRGSASTWLLPACLQVSIVPCHWVRYLSDCFHVDFVVCDTATYHNYYMYIPCVFYNVTMCSWCYWFPICHAGTFTVLVDCV